MNLLKISIGIPFTIWNELVEECVEGCLKLHYENFVIVLVPNSGENIPEKYENNSRIVISPTKVSDIAVKRNAAIRAVPAQYYACIDSDAYPESSWLVNALVAFNKSPDIWAVGGPNLSPDYKSLRKKAVANALKSFLVTGPRRFTKRLSAPRYVFDLQTCNLIFKREAIDNLNGFDECFKTGEDTDICERLVRQGKNIYFSPLVVVFHHNRSLFSPFIKQKIVFGYAVIPVVMRSFNIKRTFFFLPALFLAFLLLGWITGVFVSWFFSIWIRVVLLFVAVVTIEATRWSQKLSEIPLTFLAIIIGNLAPGLGTLMNLLRIPINFRKFYVNYNRPKYSNPI